MQATLDAFALKPFTRAIACLSKYGDELTIYATPDTLSLSATNSSKSAYCRVKYGKRFFSRFSLGDKRMNGMVVENDGIQEVQTVTGQLLTKSLLSILRHRTVEKTVEKCELSIVEGVLPTQDEEPTPSDEERDSLESRLIVRLHCKHGVIKTHRLNLQTSDLLLSPDIPDGRPESKLIIGPKAVKEMIEHFPAAKGPKSDPRLVWGFGREEVVLRSWESSNDMKGKAQLSTELTISVEEFDLYDVYSPPITIAFHLKEFNATITYAESMNVSLNIRFTHPAEPLFIEVEGDNSETLFVIATTQLSGNVAAANPQPQARFGQNLSNPGPTKKRMREDGDDGMENAGQGDSRRSTPTSSRPVEKDKAPPRKPMKAAQCVDPATFAQAQAQSRGQSIARGSMPPPTSMPFRPTSQSHSQMNMNSNVNEDGGANIREPLFLPSSQLSAADEEILRESGLGIEGMDADDLLAMLEGDGEEVGFDFAASQAMSQGGLGIQIQNGGAVAGAGDDPMLEDAVDVGLGGGDSLDLIEEMELEATQTDHVNGTSKAFRPLFED